jgi:hypothetical protein
MDFCDLIYPWVHNDKAALRLHPEAVFPDVTAVLHIFSYYYHHLLQGKL